MPGRTAHEVLDTKTKKTYPSMYGAGKALTNLVPEYTGAPNLIWFSIHRKFPDRFKIKNESGQWIEIPKAVRVKKPKAAKVAATNGEAAPAAVAKTGTGTKAKAAAETPEQKRARLQAELAAMDEADTENEAETDTSQAAEADAVEEVEVPDESEATPVRGTGKKLAAAMRTPKGN